MNHGKGWNLKNKEFHPFFISINDFDSVVNKTSSAKPIFNCNRFEKFNKRSSSFFLIFVAFVNRTE